MLKTINTPLILALSIPLVGGMVSAMMSNKHMKEDPSWYDSLKKPRWNPHSSLFPIVWTILYVLMGYASYRIFKTRGSLIPLTLYVLQLILNFTWSPIFFGQRNPHGAMFVIMALLGVLIPTITSFHSRDAVAGTLMVPYLMWTTFAATLNYEIVRLNCPCK